MRKFKENAMRVKTEIELNDIAAQLADEDNNKQGEFFNVFFKALDMACGNEYQTQMQLCNIWEMLSDRAKRRLKFITDDED